MTFPDCLTSEQVKKDEKAFDEFGCFRSRKSGEEQNHDTLGVGGGELGQRDRHDHGLQQIESLMIVGLGRNEFLKDAQETGELRPVSTDDLRRSLLHEGLKKADERRNVARSIPKD